MKGLICILVVSSMAGCGSTKNGSGPAKPGRSFKSEVDYTQYKQLVEKFYVEAGWSPAPDWEYFDKVIASLKQAEADKTSRPLGYLLLDAIGRVNAVLEAKLAAMHVDKNPMDRFARGLLKLNAAVRLLYYALNEQRGEKESMLLGARKLMEDVGEKPDSDLRAFKKFSSFMLACEKIRPKEITATCDMYARMYMEAGWTVMSLRSLLEPVQIQTFNHANDEFVHGVLSATYTPPSSSSEDFTAFIEGITSVLEGPPSRTLLTEAIDKLASVGLKFGSSNWNTNDSPSNQLIPSQQ